MVQGVLKLHVCWPAHVTTFAELGRSFLILLSEMAQAVSTKGARRPRHDPKVAKVAPGWSEGELVDGVGVVAGHGAGVVAEEAGLLHRVIGEQVEVTGGDACLTQCAW